MRGRAAADNSVRSRGRGTYAAPAAYARRGAKATREIVLVLVRAALWIGFTAAGVALNMWGAVALLLLVTPDSIWGYIALLLGTALAGSLGGAVMGMGQVLALRRWLDGAASLGSFLSAVLASCAALTLGTTIGWWVYRVASDLIGALTGLLVYGSVFGFLQRPMLDYLARNSLLWVPANAIAAVLGALAMLAAFDVSGGSRDTLQFRYVGVVYALVTGIAFTWMTRETPRALADRWGSYASGQPFSSSLQLPRADLSGTDYTDYDPDVLEVHEHRIYRIYRVHRVPRVSNAPNVGSANYPGSSGSGSGGGPSGHSPPDASGAPDVVDGTFRVLP